MMNKNSKLNLSEVLKLGPPVPKDPVQTLAPKCTCRGGENGAGAGGSCLCGSATGSGK
ncbi:hypothetical protein [Shewanella sp.]|uniref:hypothetical protein n=1 Tax=Shewanella sp. TaxID=50422 RepID=UPI00356468F2